MVGGWLSSLDGRFLEVNKVRKLFPTTSFHWLSICQGPRHRWMSLKLPRVASSFSKGPS
jgi:hypothetical protein